MPRFKVHSKHHFLGKGEGDNFDQNLGRVLSIASEAIAPAVLGTGPKVNKLPKQKKLLGNAS
jgi:hypothetical protein